nr:hypothetical protein [Tanacetum cinerariifolium]
FAVPIFSLGDDPIACLNKAMAFLIAVGSLCNKFKGDKVKVILVLDPGVPDGQAVQTIILNNVAFQIEDLDGYDFDCDDISNAKAVFMANISNYGSDVLSE